MQSGGLGAMLLTAAGACSRPAQAASSDLAELDAVETAARIKSGGGLSFADAFCVATARSLEAELWTGDPEILKLTAGFDCETRDLR